jgi:flagellar basal body-associated protein FliL
MTKIKKKHKALKIIIIVSAILIVLLGVMRYLFGNKEVMFGANDGNHDQ